MAAGKVLVCHECPVEQHFTWKDYTLHMRSVHGIIAKLSLIRDTGGSPPTAFMPRFTGECAVCHVEARQEKLGVCQECGGQFCGDHVLNHTCPLPMVI